MFNSNSKVKVMAHESGEIVVVNQAKPDYASIALEQEVVSNRDGFLNKRRRVAFLSGKTDELREIVASNNLKAGSELPGRIYVEERNTPFYEGQEPKVNPSTNEIVLVDGAQVFQKAFYDETGNTPDSYITGDVSVGGQLEARAVRLQTLATETSRLS